MSFSLFTKAFSSTLPPIEKIVLMELFNTGDDRSVSHGVCQEIADTNCITVNEVYRAIIDLHARGFITITRLWFLDMPMTFVPGTDGVEGVL